MVAGGSPITLAEVKTVCEALRRHEIPHLIIGSFCVELLLPGVLGRAPRDLDLLLPDERAPLEGFVRALGELDYGLTSWGEPVTLPLDRQRLRGRFYLRAVRDGAVVDATYECEWLAFSAALKRAVPLGSLTVASLADQKALYRARDRVADRALLGRLG